MILRRMASSVTQSPKASTRSPSLGYTAQTAVLLRIGGAFLL